MSLFAAAAVAAAALHLSPIFAQKRIRGPSSDRNPSVSFAAFTAALSSEAVPPSPAAVERQSQLFRQQPQRQAAGSVLLLEPSHGADHGADDAVVLPEATRVYFVFCWCSEGEREG